MSLLCHNLFVKPWNSRNGFVVQVAGEDSRFFGNDDLIEFLKIAAQSSSLSDIRKRLIRSGYDSNQISEKIENLWHELNDAGIVSELNSSKCSLSFLEGLSCEYQLDNATFCLTNRCNFDCLYCYNDPSDDIDFPKHLLFDVIDQAIKCGVINFSFTGGEPFLHPFLFEAIELIKLNNREVSILTNGSLLDRETIQKMVNLGVDKVGISIDSANPTVFQSMTSTNILPESILRTMAECLGKGIQVEANVVLLEGYNFNPDSLGELKNRLKELGITKHFISEATPAGNCSNLKDEITKKAFQKKIIACLGDIKPFKESIKLNDGGNRFCGIGRSGLVILPNGEVITCPALSSLNVGNVNFESLEEIWVNSESLKMIREKELNEFKHCRECNVRSDCGGACRAKAYHYEGDLWGRDPIACIQYGVRYN